MAMQTVQAGQEKYVLRKKPPGRVLASAHAVDREFRIISALGQYSEVRTRQQCAQRVSHGVLSVSIPPGLVGTL